MTFDKIPIWLTSALVFCLIFTGSFSLAYADSFQQDNTVDVAVNEMFSYRDNRICEDVELAELTESNVPIAEIDILSENMKQSSDISWDIEGTILNIKGVGHVERGKLTTLQKGKITDLIIAEGVTGIADDAVGVFASFKSLTSVSLPSTLTYIGKNAFASCNKLESLSGSPRLVSIGDRAFTGCSSLLEFNFVDGLESIGERAFAPGSEIDAAGPALTEIVLPESLKYIGRYAFRSMNELKSVSVLGETEIGYGSFALCGKLEKLRIPNVKIIGECAFQKCDALTLREIGRVDAIGSSAFSGCSQLEQVVIEDVKTIGKDAFSNCENLTSLEIKGDAPTLSGNVVGSSTCIIYPDNNLTWTDEIRKIIAWDIHNMKVRKSDGTLSGAPYITTRLVTELSIGTPASEVYSGGGENRHRVYNFSLSEKSCVSIMLSCLLPCSHSSYLVNILDSHGENVCESIIIQGRGTGNQEFRNKLLNLEPGSYHVEVSFTEVHTGADYLGWFAVGVYEREDGTASGFTFKDGAIKTNNSNVEVLGHLGGSLNEDDPISLWVMERKEGDEYTKFASSCSGRILAIYSVVMTVNGSTCHSDFGSIELRFPIPDDYIGKRVKVHHLHMSDIPESGIQSGQITNEVVSVQEGKAAISVRDLSLFAIEEEGGQITNSSDLIMGDETPNIADVISPSQGGDVSAAIPLVSTGISGGNQEEALSAGKTGLIKTGDFVGYGMAGIAFMAVIVSILVVRKRTRIPAVHHSMADSLMGMNIPVFSNVLPSIDWLYRADNQSHIEQVHCKEEASPEKLEEDPLDTVLYENLIPREKMKRKLPRII